MRPHQSISQKIPHSGILAPTAFPHAIGAAISRAAKGLLALASRAIRSAPAQSHILGEAGLLAPEHGKNAQYAGQWIWPRKPLVLPLASRLLISCNAGTVWITQGDGNDYVLKAGGTLALHPTDNVVITAMAGTAFVRQA